MGHGTGFPWLAIAICVHLAHVASGTRTRRNTWGRNVDVRDRSDWGLGLAGRFVERASGVLVLPYAIAPEVLGAGGTAAVLAAVGGAEFDADARGSVVTEKRGAYGEVGCAGVDIRPFVVKVAAAVIAGGVVAAPAGIEAAGGANLVPEAGSCNPRPTGESVHVEALRQLVIDERRHASPLRSLGECARPTGQSRGTLVGDWRWEVHRWGVWMIDLGDQHHWTGEGLRMVTCHPRETQDLYTSSTKVRQCDSGGRTLLRRRILL